MRDRAGGAPGQLHDGAEEDETAWTGVWKSERRPVTGVPGAGGTSRERRWVGEMRYVQRAVAQMLKEASGEGTDGRWQKQCG